MYVELIDYMGSDLTVVNSARVSMNKESDWEVNPYTMDRENKTLSEKDKKLISYLSKHNHFTPFTHAVITLRETVPIFVARQRFKHTVGFTYNEVSRRYVDDMPEFFIPDVWRKRAENVKQGSSDEEVDEVVISWGYHDGDGNGNKYGYQEVIDLCVEYYTEMLNRGVAPEQARMILPQSMYTSYYVTGSLAAFARAYKLRNDAHAQKEIKYLANEWDEIISPLFPESWKELTHAN